MTHRTIAALFLAVLGVLSAGCVSVDVAAPDLADGEATPGEDPSEAGDGPNDDRPDRYRVVGDSMEPNISDGEIIPVNRSADPEPGDVIIFQPVDGDATITHRVAFWVQAGEDWFDRTDPAHVGPADGCADLPTCPAPNDGWVTRGDNNQLYDQTDLADPHPPVAPARVIGVVPNE